MYEKLCIDKATDEPPSSLNQPSQDPRPDAFSSAIRRPWRRSDGHPTIRSNTSSQTFLGRSALVGRVGVAKRAVARLNSYDKVHKPLINRLHQTQTQGTVVGSGNSSTLVAGSFSELRLAEKVTKDEGHVSGSRDPRR